MSVSIDKDLEFGRIAVARGYLSKRGLADYQALLHEWIKTNYLLDLSDFLVLQHILTPKQTIDIYAEMQKRELPKKIGDFDLVCFLGEGAMGSVYKGKRQEEFAAIKVMQKSMAGNEVMIKRFLREIKVLYSLDHPNIVKVLDFGVDVKRDFYFVALEFVSGMSLDGLMLLQGALPVRRSLEIIGKVAKALEYSSKLGLIHRDIKPGNILIGDDGSVKVADFGLVKGTDSEQLTQAGIILGTPYYVAPELVQGDRDISSQIDIYSLGITLFHMLAKVPPFRKGKTAQIVIQHLLQPLPPITDYRDDIPEEVQQLIEEMAEKDPYKRITPEKVVKRTEKLTSQMKQEDLLHDLKVNVHLQRLLAGKQKFKSPPLKSPGPPKKNAAPSAGPNQQAPSEIEETQYLEAEKTSISLPPLLPDDFSETKHGDDSQAKPFSLSSPLHDGEISSLEPEPDEPAIDLSEMDFSIKASNLYKHSPDESVPTDGWGEEEGDQDKEIEDDYNAPTREMKRPPMPLLEVALDQFGESVSPAPEYSSPGETSRIGLERESPPRHSEDGDGFSHSVGRFNKFEYSLIFFLIFLMLIVIVLLLAILFSKG